ncbi:MAG: response regulator [Desulfuromusa sp.]|jgi:DNA-binding response OmpR family regulator|nr:response regulator [Desulfuromusa sp.]
MPLKVLVLDDDVQFLNLTEAYLEDKGFEVSAYLQVPRPMLEKVAEYCPLGDPIYDLILVDNDMPDMKGIEFLEYIQKKGCKISNTRKAILSGCLSSDERNRAKELGVKVFDKPCSLDVLDKWIETALNG